MKTLRIPRLATHIERVADTSPTDGMAFAPQGNLYLTDITQDAVSRLTPGGQTRIVAQNTQLK